MDERTTTNTTDTKRHGSANSWRKGSSPKVKSTNAQLSMFGPEILPDLSSVTSSLEILGYAVRAADLPAAGVGAPHIRQRCFFMADRDSERRHGEPILLFSGQSRQGGTETSGSRADGCSGRLAHSNGGHTCAEGLQRSGEYGFESEDGLSGVAQGDADSTGPLPSTFAGVRGGEEISGPRDAEPQRLGRPVGVVLDDAERQGLEGHAGHGHNWRGREEQARPIAPAGIVGGFWSGAELIPCSDGFWRPIEPCAEPLVDGSPQGMVCVRDAGALSPEEEAEETFPLIRNARGRTMRLRGYGDAINAEAAAEFISAVMETLDA